MFNEYMDHANQCATYYSVVRKDEINLQQNDTNRFKQKWLEVAGGSNVSSSNTYSNNPTPPPNHVSATSKQPPHLFNHQTNLMPANAPASTSQSPNQIYINMNQYSANSTGKHMYDQSGISVGKSSSNATTLNTGMQQLNQPKQANNLEPNQHDHITHQQHIKQQANAQKKHFSQQIQQHQSVPQHNNQIQYQQKFYEPFIPNMKTKDNSAPNLNANQQHHKQHRQSPSPIILNNNTNINNSGLNQNPNNYSQPSNILNNSYENSVGHKIINAQHGLANNTINGVVGAPNHQSNTKIEPQSVHNFNNLLLHQQHQASFHNQVYPNSQLQQQFNNNNKSNTSYHQPQQGYHLNQQHQMHHHQQHQYQASQDYSFDLNSPRVNSPLNPSISNYTINSVNSSNSGILTSSNNLDSTLQHSSDGATYVKKISPCMLPQQKFQQTKTEQTNNNLTNKSPTPLSTNSMSTHLSNSIDAIYNNCLNENNQASIKSPRIIVNSPSSLNTSLSVSTPLNTQGNLIDLNQDQLIADDCDSNLLSPLNNQTSMKTTIIKTLSSSSILASSTNGLSQSNSSERTSNINNSSFSNSKSILSEINIDELFTHYPNVFEELFYSFKLNSIEQIEHDLRTYCEQQFKLNFSTKNTNCQSSNSTQQFSIRI